MALLFSTEEHACPPWALAVSSATAQLGTFPSKARMTDNHPGQGEDPHIFRVKTAKLHLLPPIRPRLALTIPCCSKCSPWPSSICITWGLRSSAASQTHPHPPPHTHRISICISTRSPEDSYAQSHPRSPTPGLLFRIGCVIILY